MKLFFVSLVLCLFASSVYGEASLRFVESPDVNGRDEIYLGDIAVLENLEDQDRQALEQVKIADSIDKLKKMSSHDIMRRIRPQVRLLEKRCDCKLHVTLPRVFAAKPAAPVFSMEAVQERVIAELKKDCEACHIEASEMHIISGLVPESFKKWDVVHRKNEWRGPTMVRVYFDDDAFSPVVMQTLIKIKQPVLRLKGPIPSGTAIKAENCEEVLADITYETKKFAQAGDLHAVEAKRTLPEGWTLTLDDLTAQNMVRIGQEVSVEIQNSSISIEMTGIAQKTGKLGEKIPVRLNKTRKQINAEIISDARVRM